MGGALVTRHPPGRIRIVAGEKRGHRIRVPLMADLRPTGERVREAIFNVLGPVDDLLVLDLFAGTGAMGLEALSRGARRCVFVENDSSVAAVLLENISSLDYQSRSRVITTDYRRALSALEREKGGFDLLFVDPPDRMLPEVEATLGPLLPLVVGDDGVVVVEGAKSRGVTLGRVPVFDRTYGDTRVTMISMRRSVP